MEVTNRKEPQPLSTPAGDGRPLRFAKSQKILLSGTQRLLIRLTVWFAALVVGVTPVGAHGADGHGGAPVAFAVVLGLPIIAGLVGGAVIVRCRNEDHRAGRGHPTSIGLLLIVLGITFAGTALSRSLSLGIGGGIVGSLSVLWAAHSRASKRHGHLSHANLSLGAVFLHRLFEGIVLGTLYSVGAAVGLLGAVVIAGHTALETVAVGGLFTPHRLRVVGAVVLLQVGYAVGAMVGIVVAGTVPSSVHTIALALAGGILLVTGINESRRASPIHPTEIPIKGQRARVPDGGQRVERERTAITLPIKRRLEMQGFTCSSDPAFEAVVPWLRLSPALTTTVATLGIILPSPLVLVTLALVTGFCAVTTRHPFDLLYNHGIRTLIGSATLPRNEVPRRFACGMATVWLVMTAIAFWRGTTLVGYVLGLLLIAFGGLVATTHFCFGALVYRVLVRRGAELFLRS
ncbi:DUF4395 family protein [Haloarchaeobius litoreus]|uniref:DUF4395 family protein n=1 Tax=Haloarchaeobius litoreus TaxID=755306 RepID=A0ABD6DKX8_9EURY|nr:DUF4395 family protein [Haloarchaeobius litoreus]